MRWCQEVRRFKPSTVSRRTSVVCGFYRTCVIDGLLEHSPAQWLRRPTVPPESPGPSPTMTPGPSPTAEPVRGAPATNRACSCRVEGVHPPIREDRRSLRPPWISLDLPARSVTHLYHDALQTGFDHAAVIADIDLAAVS